MHGIRIRHLLSIRVEVSSIPRTSHGCFTTSTLPDLLVSPSSVVVSLAKTSEDKQTLVTPISETPIDKGKHWPTGILISKPMGAIHWTRSANTSMSTRVEAQQQ